mmetsp:Transcript_2901/g.9146  ORF Transcript_2901/g.9146 Transcript_2901/m.9146 type:complete len:358 (-) Transcript_2901:837-1910(-)
MKMCWPTGRPRSVVGVASPKRKRRVLSLISSRSMSGISTQADLSSATGFFGGLAATAGAGAPPCSVPMRYFSSSFHAFSEWSASKSSVASVPAAIRMEEAPPGCSSRYGVASYTTPLTAIQQSSLVECLAISASENCFSPPVGAAAAAAAGTAAFGASPCLPSTCSSNQPPKLPGPASVGCWKRSAGMPASSSVRCTCTRKYELFIMPITFQTMLSGCRFIAASQARQQSIARSGSTPLPIEKSSDISTSCSQKTQHQKRPYSVGFSVRLIVVRVHVLPPSRESSTRIILRPPPLYAYPPTVYVCPLPVSRTVSWWPGKAMAELMLSSLMMKSGLYHHPSAVARSASTNSGSTRLSM